MSRQRRHIPWLLLTPALGVYTGFVAFPILRTFVISLQDYRMDAAAPPTWSGMANYARVVHDPYVGHALRTSVLYTLMVVPAVLILSGICAIALDRVGRKSRWLRPWILMPMVVAAPILAAVWFTVFEGNRGMLNEVLATVGVTNPPQWLGVHLALISVSMAYAWGGIAFGTLLYTVALDRIDPQLYEAAAVDGAGPVQQIRNVTLPGMARMAGIIAVLVGINTMRDFQYPFVMTAGGPAGATRTFSYAIYRTAFVDAPLDLGYASAMSILFAVGLLAVSLGVMQISRRGSVE